MAKKSGREKLYAEQLQELGIYDEAFDPEIKTLATLERELTRAKKEWSESAAEGGKPDFSHDLYGVIQNLRREILTHREALGLTPKSLRRLRGSPEPPVKQDLITERLAAIQERVNAYALPVFGSDTEAETRADVGIGPYVENGEAADE